MVSIFLSHSSKDHDFVQELASKLEKRGIKVWVDDAEIKAGDSFIDKFSQAIDEVNFVGVVLSQNSIESGWVKQEINMGVYNEIRKRNMADPDSMFPSLGDELLGAGVHGVVAMAYSVHVRTASKFMAKVYELLVNGYSLERAVSASRQILCNDDLHDSPAGEIHLKDWPVPVIFQSGSVRLFEPPKNRLALDTEIKGEQEKAGGEIDLPDKPDYGFIGRDALMLDMERAFRRENVIILQGMAGMGKSTLSVGFSRWLGETGGLDGPIFFFDFQKHLTLAHICDKVGGVFYGTRWHSLDTPEKRENTALNALKQVPCLLIWDNFETVMGFPRGSATPWSEEERSELQKFLSKTRDSVTKVIITSRMDEKWLGTWIERLMVEGLDMQEAYELAGKVLEKERIDRKNLKPYNELLECLRGNPLAIRVMMQELRHIEPDELLRQLKSGEAKLKYDDAEQGRTKSLTVSLNYRLDNMDPGLRKRLSILALFQGVVNCMEGIS